MGWSIEEYCARSIQGFAASKIGAHSAENFRQRVVAVKFEENKNNASTRPEAHSELSG
jgi:hypothetical protein